METILSFKRHEKKYLLSAEQQALLKERLAGRIEPDLFHRSTVCSLYYDAEDYRLIRRSLDQPTYKEKLRLRSYGTPAPGDEIFVELKKKYRGVVYKRRVTMEVGRAMDWLAGDTDAGQEGQMIREIEWFLRLNRVAPRVLIACDREAWRGAEDPTLRITFDENIRWRETELDLRAGDGGAPILQDGRLLMELKLQDTVPLWLAHMLSELRLYPARFSKYGTAYRENILPEFMNGVNLHA